MPAANIAAGLLAGAEKKLRRQAPALKHTSKTITDEHIKNCPRLQPSFDKACRPHQLLRCKSHRHDCLQAAHNEATYHSAHIQSSPYNPFNRPSFNQPQWLFSSAGWAAGPVTQHRLSTMMTQQTPRPTTKWEQHTLTHTCMPTGLQVHPVAKDDITHQSHNIHIWIETHPAAHTHAALPKPRLKAAGHFAPPAPSQCRSAARNSCRSCYRCRSAWFCCSSCRHRHWLMQFLSLIVCCAV
jgi:hypothetical protein